MIRFAIIVIGIMMIIKKLYQILKSKIENYNDTSNKHFFNVQLANTEKEREIGLMWVKKLKLDSGMLFEYPDKTYPSMWMKNTLIPLDAIFINSDARVVHIEHNMKPNSKQKHKTKKMCKYVLEINGGLAEKIGIKEGDLIGTTLLNKNITNFKEPKKNSDKKEEKQEKKNKPEPPHPQMPKLNSNKNSKNTKKKKKKKTNSKKN